MKELKHRYPSIPDSAAPDQEERVQYGEPESDQAELQHVRRAVLERESTLPFGKRSSLTASLTLCKAGGETFMVAKF